MKLIIIALLLIVMSGCFPVFVPVDDGRHRGGGEREHGEHHGEGRR
jgi:hypothetical protein